MVIVTFVRHQVMTFFCTSVATLLYFFTAQKWGVGTKACAVPAMQIFNCKQAGHGLLQQAIFVGGGGGGGPLESALSKKELNYLFKCNLLPAKD